MRRNKMFVSLATFFPAGMLLLCAPAPLCAEERPNIILAMADDQGWRDVGYNPEPGKVAITPHLDRMAAEGVCFSRFYSSSPNCAPTRAALLTGRHCHRSGVFNPGFALHPRELTIAEVLQEAGYATAHFGKWHLGPVKASSPVNPHVHGFDHYVSHDNFFDLDPALSRNGAEPEEFEGDGSEVIIDEALKFIDGVQDFGKPFFAFICFGSCRAAHGTSTGWPTRDECRVPRSWGRWSDGTGSNSKSGSPTTARCVGRGRNNRRNTTSSTESRASVRDVLAEAFFCNHNVDKSRRLPPGRQSHLPWEA